jgi:hypothetical protein
MQAIESQNQPAPAVQPAPAAFAVQVAHQAPLAPAVPAVQVTQPAQAAVAELPQPAEGAVVAHLAPAVQVAQPLQVPVFVRNLALEAQWAQYKAEYDAFCQARQDVADSLLKSMTSMPVGLLDK